MRYITIFILSFDGISPKYSLATTFHIFFLGNPNLAEPSPVRGALVLVLDQFGTLANQATIFSGIENVSNVKVLYLWNALKAWLCTPNSSVLPDTDDENINNG